MPLDSHQRYRQAWRFHTYCISILGQDTKRVWCNWWPLSIDPGLWPQYFCIKMLERENHPANVHASVQRQACQIGEMKSSFLESIATMIKHYNDQTSISKGQVKRSWLLWGKWRNILPTWSWREARFKLGSSRNDKKKQSANKNMKRQQHKHLIWTLTSVLSPVIMVQNKGT